MIASFSYKSYVWSFPKILVYKSYLPDIWYQLQITKKWLCILVYYCIYFLSY